MKNSKVKHTPGPWEMNGPTVVRGSRKICDVSFDYKIGTINANSKLISAAPELLEALELAYSRLNEINGTVGISNTLLTVCKNAIAKAKGEE